MNSKNMINLMFMYGVLLKSFRIRLPNALTPLISLLRLSQNSKNCGVTTGLPRTNAFKTFTVAKYR